MQLKGCKGYTFNNQSGSHNPIDMICLKAGISNISISTGGLTFTIGKIITPYVDLPKGGSHD